MNSFAERFKPQGIASESMAAKIIREKALVYDVRTTDDKGNDWFYILNVPSGKRQAFLSAMEGTESFTVTDFGEILHSGRNEPSDALKAELRKKYGMYEN